MSAAYLVHAFDLINVADLDLIRQVEERATNVIAVVLTDEQITSLSGRPPVVPLSERLALVGHMRGVSSAVVCTGDAISTSADVFTTSGVAGALGLVATELTPATSTASALLGKALRPVESEVA